MRRIAVEGHLLPWQSDGLAMSVNWESDAIRFTSLLPSRCQGEPTTCMGFSQMCALQVDVGKEPPDWPHHLQGYIWAVAVEL